MTLAADWYTGENAIGYFTPGVIVGADSFTVYASYSFKNGDSRGDAILTELGFLF